MERTVHLPRPEGVLVPGLGERLGLRVAMHEDACTCRVCAGYTWVTADECYPAECAAGGADAAISLRVLAPLWALIRMGPGASDLVSLAWLHFFTSEMEVLGSSERSFCL